VPEELAREPVPAVSITRCSCCDASSCNHMTRTCKLDSGFMDRSKDLTTVSFLVHSYGRFNIVSSSIIIEIFLAIDLFFGLLQNI